ncbi:hypothetical protein [Desulfosporosinus sp. FKA]|uniref:hypothetical protein n=1 Tax=Desulfosporosinus sp. FKA TaxID=1969834 RepID=UPI000B4A311B|nr:hypothetical protein [Desulfosporosinus sp. FKA]
MPLTKEVNILELAQGAIQEQVMNETGVVLANILDPNTDATTARKLTVTLTFKPDENRNVVKLSASAKATTAPIKSITTSIMVDQDRNGNPCASEILKNDPNQMAVFSEDQVTNVIKLNAINS